MKIVLATSNIGKLREYGRLLELPDIELLSLSDFPGLADVEETGATFKENALIKAGAAAKATGCIALADDSGLTVDILSGRPGVLSARYAGEGASDEDNNKKLLNELADVPIEKRGAAFVCVIAVVHPDGRSVTAAGRRDGYIASAPKGKSGFGYDPIFYLPDKNRTMAEVPLETKNLISHRAAAARELKRVLPGFLAEL